MVRIVVDGWRPHVWWIALLVMAIGSLLFIAVFIYVEHQHAMREYYSESVDES